MSPARRRLGSVRAVAERLLRGTPRRTPAEELAATLGSTVPGLRAASLVLAAGPERVPPPEAGSDAAEETPWLEPEDPAVLEKVVLRIDPALFAGDPVVLPGPELVLALRNLGWTQESGLDGPVRDDVDTVTLHGPGTDSPEAYRTLWASAEVVAREALAAGARPGSTAGLPTA